MIRHAMRIRRHVATAAAFTYVSLFMAPAAHASGSSMPWEAPLQSIADVFDELFGSVDLPDDLKILSCDDKDRP